MFKRIISALLLLLTIFLVGCGNSDKPFSKLSQKEQDSFVWLMAVNSVKEKLKSPSTAKFSSQSAATISHNGNNKYEVKSYVEAQNGFGAMTKNYFTVVLEVAENYDTIQKGYGYNTLECNIK